MDGLLRRFAPRNDGVSSPLPPRDSNIFSNNSLNDRQWPVIGPLKFHYSVVDEYIIDAKRNIA
jgi:hypothetical protein